MLQSFNQPVQQTQAMNDLTKGAGWYAAKQAKTRNAILAHARHLFTITSRQKVTNRSHNA
jgi:hypothetical protein